MDRKTQILIVAEDRTVALEVQRTLELMGYDGWSLSLRVKRQSRKPRSFALIWS